MNLPATYDFRMDAWKPDTLPMARLAQYLSKLAALFGHTDQVHFIKVRKGSVIQEIHVEQTAAPKVQARLRLVATGQAPEELAKIQQALNSLLREDGASATLGFKAGAKIIDFPGCKTPLADEAIVHENGELIGAVIRVGGKDDTVPLLLQDTDGSLYPCNTTRALARELARHLFGDSVRVQGAGKWRRTPERLWELDEFKIKSWEPLEQTSLEQTVVALRKIDGSLWNSLTDPQAELRKLREA